MNATSSISGTFPGFANPVENAQSVFRNVLEAFSRPGVFVPLAALPHPLAGDSLPQGLIALALTLCDNDTPIWLDAAANTAEARRHLRFHCAAPVTDNAAEAAFAFISSPANMPRLSSFNPGRADFPDRSATLVLRVDQHEGTEALEVTGPGIKGNERYVWLPFRIGSLPSWFLEDWAENHAAYPLGVDILFIDSGIDAAGQDFAAVLGLPRTARLRRGLKESAACM